DSVRVDNAGGAYELATYLIGLGHMHIGVVAGPSNVGSTVERVAGLRKAFNDHAGTLRVRYGAPTREDAYIGAKELFAECPHITAIVGTADQLAIGALAYLTDIGKRVPTEI